MFWEIIGGITHSIFAVLAAGLFFFIAVQLFSPRTICCLRFAAAVYFLLLFARLAAPFDVYPARRIAAFSSDLRFITIAGLVAFAVGAAIAWFFAAPAQGKAAHGLKQRLEEENPGRSFRVEEVVSRHNQCRALLVLASDGTELRKDELPRLLPPEFQGFSVHLRKDECSRLWLHALRLPEC